MSALREAQSAFVEDVAELIAFGVARGLAFTFGDAFAKEGHMRDSLHYVRLAIDINMFINGEWISGDHEEWHALGEYWKSLDPLNRWGGDIARQSDYNHVSRVPNAEDPRI